MATAAAPSHGESTATVVDPDEGTTWRSLPTDAFVEILLRLPPSSRRWVRLVCRHWRAVIDERTPPPQSKPAVLACFTSTTAASAYVIDDLATGACRQVWGVRSDPNATARDRRRVDVTMVGTCNGLLCLCDNTRPGGAISLLNPATCETLRLPPLPPVSHQGGRYRMRDSRKHVFAHRMRDSGEVRSLRIREQGTVAAYCKDGYHLGTFAYVETTEPLLSLFKRRATKLSS